MNGNVTEREKVNLTFARIEEFNHTIHDVMRKFCVDKLPKVISAADSLSHTFAIISRSADVEEEETVQAIYTKNWNAVNAKL